MGPYIKEVSEAEHSNARGMLVEVKQPQMGPVKIPGCPINFSKTPVDLSAPAPLVGEHTKELLCQFLGYTEEEYQKFKKDKVI